MITQGKNHTINHFKNRIKIITIIGVKSSGQIVVGIYFFIKLYIGSKTCEIKTGLIFKPKILSQDSITSAIII